jgi:hypothetical protein
MKSEAAKQAQERYLSSDKGREAARKAKRAYRQTEKGQRVHASSLLKQRYGITLEDKECMYKEQHGLCGFCHQPLPKAISKCCVDHDHETGEVRKLLHTYCNVMAGWAESNRSNIIAYFKW